MLVSNLKNSILVFKAVTFQPLEEKEFTQNEWSTLYNNDAKLREVVSQPGILEVDPTGSIPNPDFNNLKTTGIYSYKGTWDNAPTADDGILVISTSASSVVQNCTTESGVIFQRAFLNSAWSPWSSSIALPPLTVPIGTDADDQPLHLRLEMSNEPLFEDPFVVDTSVSTTGCFVFASDQYLPFPAAGVGREYYESKALILRNADYQYKRYRWSDGEDFTPWEAI